MRISDWSSDVCSSDLKTLSGVVDDFGVGQLDIETKRTHFLDEHVEALRNAGLEGIVALDDRFVDLGAADHVVGFHRQHFLQGICSAIGLKRPDLPFAEALAAELCLAAQRLLGDEAVRSDRARKSVVEGKSVSVRVGLGGRRIIKKKNT